MNIQIIGTKKCKNTQKALRFFKERGVKPHFRDLSDGPLKMGEIKNILRSVTEDELINRESPLFEKLNLHYIQHDPVSKVLEEPMLLNTPVVRSGSISIVGFDPDGWKELLENN